MVISPYNIICNAVGDCGSQPTTTDAGFTLFLCVYVFYVLKFILVCFKVLACYQMTMGLSYTRK